MTDQNPPGIDSYDDVEMWRCRQLAGPVTFKYCRVMNDGLPCEKLLACWSARIDLVVYLSANYSAEDLQRAFGAVEKGRMTRIVDTINKVRDRGRR